MRLSEAAPAAIAEPQVPTPEDSYSRTRVLPDLPPAAQRLGINHGQVLVRLHLSAAGTVNRVELVRADAPQLFDAQVRRTLEGWTYEPTGRVQQKIVELNFHP
jgi:TonB family protein